VFIGKIAKTETNSLMAVLRGPKTLYVAYNKRTFLALMLLNNILS
jgi:hypothetical protein